MLNLLEDTIDTPLGPLWVICDEQFRLRAVEWDQHSDRMEQLLDIHYRTEGYQRITAKNPGGLSDKLAVTNSLSILPETSASLTRWKRQPLGRLSSVKSGKRYALSPAGRSCIMVNWPNSWDAPVLQEPSAQLMAPIQ